MKHSHSLRFPCAARFALHLSLAACMVMTCSAQALADNWNVNLNDLGAIPKRMVAVDKGRQFLYVYERSSPLRKLYESQCTSGQRTGAKMVSGDLRTPEGVYFVVNKIGAKLDFMEYGDIAYALNYPNPMDKLAGKTGYGIWIHSRGRDITPTETKGCVAVNLADMDKLAPQLVAGTPVLLAETISSGKADSQQAAVLSLIEKKTRQWNAAWAGRSNTFFDFYDGSLYTKAQPETFQAFKNQKERLFGQLPWIHIIHGDIQVMQGPDYWVSWFNQYYRAPNLATEGIRRLYWKANGNGELRIVGMEWIPANLGMETAYLENITPSVTKFIDNWRMDWQKGNLKAYMTAYAPDARQHPRAGAASIEQHKRATWASKKPKIVKLTGIRVKMLQNGVSVDMTQEYEDTSGYKDRGTKTLMLYPKAGSWIIASEDWSALPK